MDFEGKTALITGGASGIGRAIVELLASKCAKVYILDLDVAAAQSLADGINSSLGRCSAKAISVDVASWDSQLEGFKSVVADARRIDWVFPVAGVTERSWIWNDPHSRDFVKPDLTTLDVDLYGVLHTASLAIQQFRRQERDRDGVRGKIGCVASVCGFYCVATLPIYTAAKHAVVGFVRSYGKHLIEEGITLNAVCPNVVRTNISSSAFYESMESQDLLTPMKGVVDAMEEFLTSNVSGDIIEVGPNGGFAKRAFPEFLDEKSARCCDALYQRGLLLHPSTN